ncbi:MAG: pyridoxamine 5'-phosphate oxidase family protein, partial [Acidimicrobiales bacterium]
MSSWAEFEMGAPDLAAAARRLLAQHGLAYLGTVRPDGGPRVHPVAPVLTDAHLLVAIGDWSPKWRDLRRDPRCILHLLPGPADDEVVMGCRATERSELFEVASAAASHTIHADDHVIELEIDRFDHGWWERVGQPDTAPIRYRWTAAEGVIR